MTPFTANMMNGLVLLTLGVWGALESVMNKIAGEGFSPTVFIAPVFGIIFLLLGNGFKTNNKVVVHIVVVLTLLIVVSLIKPLMGREGLAQIRVAIMLLTSAVALVVFIKSFIDARKNRAA